MSSKIKSKPVVQPLSDFERRLAKFFFIAAALSLVAVLWNFAPSYHVVHSFSSWVENPNGFVAAFGIDDYFPNAPQIISILAMGASALLSLYFAVQTIQGEKQKNRGLIVVASIVLDLGALILQYLGYLNLEKVNDFEAVDRTYAISWGFILVAAFALTSMFIKWFFVNRLEAPKK